MNHPEGQSTGIPFTPNPDVVQITQGKGGWFPPADTGTTGGGSGGGDLEKRVSILETHVGHIQSDITNIKDDIRVGLGLIIGAFLAVGGLYLYVDGKTDTITVDLNKHNIDATKEFGAIKNDINNIKNDVKNISSQNEEIIQDIENLTITINKIAGMEPIVKDQE